MGNARTYVVCFENVVVGYYCLSAGSIVRTEAIKSVQRNAADPVPAIVMGRLAIALSHQGQGLGRGLGKDALLRELQASDAIGARAFIVHALNEQVKQFYLGIGFKESIVAPKTLMIPFKDVRRAPQ